ncbi:unnamed protein product [Owenia fusiformis]|uniref:Uncharacterized protein n=1 Tax=Owenia fusiformis TaxID=6347 RepID=A0A8J1UWS3_OWEFU|nr:unnamed protein product [Owenia fusiformis]
MASDVKSTAPLSGEDLANIEQTLQLLTEGPRADVIEELDRELEEDECDVLRDYLFQKGKVKVSELCDNLYGVLADREEDQVPINLQPKLRKGKNRKVTLLNDISDLYLFITDNKSFPRSILSTNSFLPDVIGNKELRQNAYRNERNATVDINITMLTQRIVELEADRDSHKKEIKDLKDEVGTLFSKLSKLQVDVTNFVKTCTCTCKQSEVPVTGTLPKPLIQANSKPQTIPISKATTLEEIVSEQQQMLEFAKQRVNEVNNAKVSKSRTVNPETSDSFLSLNETVINTCVTGASTPNKPASSVKAKDHGYSKTDHPTPAIAPDPHNTYIITDSTPIEVPGTNKISSQSKTIKETPSTFSEVLTSPSNVSDNASHLPGKEWMVWASNQTYKKQKIAAKSAHVSPPTQPAPQSQNARALRGAPVDNNVYSKRTIKGKQFERYKYLYLENVFQDEHDTDDDICDDVIKFGYEHGVKIMYCHVVHNRMSYTHVGCKIAVVESNFQQTMIIDWPDPIVCREWQNWNEYRRIRGGTLNAYDQ